MHAFNFVGFQESLEVIAEYTPRSNGGLGVTLVFFSVPDASVLDTPQKTFVIVPYLTGFLFFFLGFGLDSILLPFL